MRARPLGGSWRLPTGLVSCCSPPLRAELKGDGVSPPLHRRLGGAQLLAGKSLQQQFVPWGCRVRFRHRRERPDLPLQHQQPTRSMQGDGLAARQGPAPSPMTDRQTNRQISFGSGLALPVPPLTSAGLLPRRPGCRQPARCGAVPSLPCPGSMRSSGRVGGPTGPGTRGW